MASAARLGLLGGRTAAAELAGERRYINRELSTLDFNGRVLALAENQELPLLERIKFLAIFSATMDEFFQVRVAGLKDQQAAGISGTAPDGLSVSDQLTADPGRGGGRSSSGGGSPSSTTSCRGWPSRRPPRRTGSPLTTRTAPGSRRCSSSGSFRC